MAEETGEDSGGVAEEEETDGYEVVRMGEGAIRRWVIERIEMCSCLTQRRSAWWGGGDGIL